MVEAVYCNDEKDLNLNISDISTFTKDFKRDIDNFEIYFIGVNPRNSVEFYWVDVKFSDNMSNVRFFIKKYISETHYDISGKYKKRESKLQCEVDTYSFFNSFVSEKDKFKVPWFKFNLDKKILFMEYIPFILDGLATLFDGELHKLKFDLFSDSVEALAVFHNIGFENRQGLIYSPYRLNSFDRDDYSDRIVNYLRGVVVRNLGLGNEDGKKYNFSSCVESLIREYSSKLILNFTRFSDHIIHWDLFPGHVGFTDKGVVFFDYDHVGFGPCQYDLCSLLKNPFANFSDEELTELYNIYLSNRHDIFVSEKDKLKFYKGVFYCDVYNSIRSMGVGCWHEIVNPDSYHRSIDLFKMYDNSLYCEWHVNNLENLIKTAGYFGLDRRDISDIDELVGVANDLFYKTGVFDILK